MAQLDEQSKEIMAAAQSYVKRGDRSTLEQYDLASMTKADLQLGDRDLNTGFRKAILTRIEELKEAEASAREAANQPLVERIKNGIVNHPVLSWGVVVIVALMFIGNVTDSIDKLIDFYDKHFAVTKTAADWKQIGKINKEIANRLIVFPGYIKKSRGYTKVVPKANVISNLYRRPGATYLKPLFPAYKERSIISLCHDIKENSTDDIWKEEYKDACATMETINRLAEVDYDVQAMYILSIDEMIAAEDRIETFYKHIIEAQSAWGVPLPPPAVFKWVVQSDPQKRVVKVGHCQEVDSLVFQCNKDSEGAIIHISPDAFPGRKNWIAETGVHQNARQGFNYQLTNLDQTIAVQGGGSCGNDLSVTRENIVVITCSEADP